MRQLGYGVGHFGVVLLFALLGSVSALAEKISIVMPAYNSAAYISDAIRSVLDQTHSDWELIVVNDGSTDNTSDVVARFAATDDRIRLVTLALNGGVGNARNAALRHVSARYVAFLDSDDFWLPRKLEEQLAFMQENDFALTFTAYRALGSDGRSVGAIVRSHPAELKYQDLLKQNQIPVFTVMLDREKVGDFAFYSGYNEDFLLWLYFAKQNISAHLLDQDLGRLRRLPTSISANKFRAAKEFWIVLRKHEQLGLTTAAFYFLNYATRSVLKYLFKHRNFHWFGNSCPANLLQEATNSE
ncbi:MAG: glycosyltransferase family 2 protein [Bdellovibrionales bacterium]|nr:glycosyltransferase family 2 protein [Bdellovibrionales bacterium]